MAQAQPGTKEELSFCSEIWEEQSQTIQGIKQDEHALPIPYTKSDQSRNINIISVLESNSSPCRGTWCLRRVLGPSRPYSVGLGPMKTSNLVSHGHIRGGPFFEFFRSDVCSQSYEVKHASSLHAFGRCTREYKLDPLDKLLFS